MKSSSSETESHISNKVMLLECGGHWKCLIYNFCNTDECFEKCMLSLWYKYWISFIIEQHQLVRNKIGAGVSAFMLSVDYEPQSPQCIKHRGRLNQKVSYSVWSLSHQRSNMQCKTCQAFSQNSPTSSHTVHPAGQTDRAIRGQKLQ